ncbi:hypothetical protein SAMN05421679_103343 [Epilithonimonas pallida]|uniref:Cytochrome c oxidase subunit 4 n=1 Tax=Epilithonimonas pallida TaxID=373671 RepID=A0ABY1R1N0_9FLAO|nr:hypothetical protein SAMN05421679_103343 [Epilithonimonas pallida]
MRPVKKNRLSQPSEFIKMMVVSLVFVSVFLFSKKISQEQMVINLAVLLFLFFILQLVFVIMYKKGVKTWAFWLLILLGLIGVAGAITIWYVLKYGLTFQN